MKRISTRYAWPAGTFWKVSEVGTHRLLFGFGRPKGADPESVPAPFAALKGHTEVTIPVTILEQ